MTAKTALFPSACIPCASACIPCASACIPHAKKQERPTVPVALADLSKL